MLSIGNSQNILSFGKELILYPVKELRDFIFRKKMKEKKNTARKSQ